MDVKITQNKTEGKSNSNELEEIDQQKSKKENFGIIVASVIITAILVGGGVYFWQQSVLSSVEEKVQKQIGSMQNQVNQVQSQCQSSTDEVKESLDAALNATNSEWPAYINKKYGYQFQYPAKAEIGQAEKIAFSLSPAEAAAGVTFDDVYEKYTGDLCVSIVHGSGIINISAPENKDYKYVICGRTGAGQYDQTRSKEETLTVEGKTYTAKGTEFITGDGNTLDKYSETMKVELNDGTQIQYGSSGGNETTYQEYLVIRGELIRIIESYREID